MSKAIGSLGLAAIIGGAAWGWAANAEPPHGLSTASLGGGRELVTHFLPGEGQPTALTIVDPLARTIGVYFINRESGEIELKSVRNFSADLQMEQLNNSGLLPQEIRQGLERQP